MIAHWYDVLDLDPSASEEEIRVAWREAIADLTPADRRFRLYNQAAEVLLDPVRRAEYDAELAEQEAADQVEAGLEDESDLVEPEQAEPEQVEPEQVEPEQVEPGQGESAPVDEVVVVAHDADKPSPVAGPRRGVPTWLLAALALLVALSLGLSGYLFSQPTEASIEEATGSARAAAERAVVPVLSYDYRTLDQDQQDSQDLLTPDYRGDYDDLFEVIRDNAEPTKTVVEVEVIASAVVRAGQDRVEVLVFVNRPTTNAETKEPVVYKDQVTLTMQRVDGDWLVDNLKTSPVQQ